MIHNNSAKTPSNGLLLLINACRCLLKLSVYLIRRVLWAGVMLYRLVISPFLAPRCRFYPSCSQYAASVLLASQLPLHRALWCVVRRLSRCHARHPGGVDLPPLAKDQRD